MFCITSFSEIPKSAKKPYCLEGLLGTDEFAGVKLLALINFNELGLFKE